MTKNVLYAATIMTIVFTSVMAAQEEKYDPDNTTQKSLSAPYENVQNMEEEADSSSAWNPFACITHIVYAASSALPTNESILMMPFMPCFTPDHTKTKKKEE